MVYCLVIQKLKREIIKQFPKECQDKILEKIWQSPNEILKFLSAPNFNKVTGITKVPQKRKKKKRNSLNTSNQHHPNENKAKYCLCKNI